jgi:hypothetical protein
MSDNFSSSESSVSSMLSSWSANSNALNVPMNQENLIVTLTNLEFLKKLSKSSIVEALFILSKLMFGSKKIQVQKRLHKVGIIHIVNKLYCLLLKTMDSVAPGHDMKIQILKLVINYLSRDSYNLENKLECVSQQELILLLKQEIAPCLLHHYGELDEEAQDYAKEISYIPSSISLTKSTEYNESKLGSLKLDFGTVKDHRGFISKIIESFLKSYISNDNSISVSNLRYWQASSIESFVRGCNPFLQLFIARSGILRVLINDIVSIQSQDDANLQTAFDILGETIKFNKRVILIFESHIAEAELPKFQEK